VRAWPSRQSTTLLTELVEQQQIQRGAHRRGVGSEHGRQVQRRLLELVARLPRHPFVLLFSRATPASRHFAVRARVSILCYNHAAYVGARQQQAGTGALATQRTASAALRQRHCGHNASGASHRQRVNALCGTARATRAGQERSEGDAAHAARGSCAACRHMAKAGPGTSNTSICAPSSTRQWTTSAWPLKAA
jgi:hypothetical protein